MALWLAICVLVGGVPLFFGLRSLNRVLLGSATSFGFGLATVVVALAVGLFGGWQLLSVRYPWASDLHAIGFPLPIAFYQLMNGDWLDHTGSMGLPMALGNLAFWVGLSALVSGWCVRFIVKRSVKRAA
jgi:hypothetical protein